MPFGKFTKKQIREASSEWRQKKKAQARRRARRVARSANMRPADSTVAKHAKLYGGPRGPFPRNLWTKLVYSDEKELTSSLGSVAGNTWNINSMYDPDSTGTGHQPMYFDTLCGADDGSAPYSAYRVHSALIEATFSSNTTSVSKGGCILGVIGKPGGTAVPDTYVEVKEVPGFKSAELVTLGANGNSKVKLSIFVNMKDILGNKDLSDNDKSGALYNANPGTLIQAVTRYQDTIGGTSAVECTYRITFYCQFYQMNKVDLS